MPIDAHIHIGATSATPREERADRLLAMLQRYGIDAAIVLPLEGLFSSCFDHPADNDFVRAFCRRAPERLIPAFTVNPLLGDKALDEVRRCRNEHGLRILKLHPWLQGFSISSAEMNAVAALCEELDITIVFHDGTPPYCAPLQVARLCRDYPALRVVSGHSGLNDLWPDALAAAKRYRNFYLCLCGLAAWPVQQIVAEIPPEQICVGSDWINDTEDVFWYRWNLWRRIPVPAEVRGIIEDETPRRLMG